MFCDFFFNLFYFSYSFPLLHLLLCDTLLISDIHSGLIYWVRHIKTLEMFDTDSCELVQTVSAICAGFPNKRRDLLHEQGCKIPANQSIIGTKSINKWEVRKCVPGRNVATQMVPGITPACVHTCARGAQWDWLCDLGSCLAASEPSNPSFLLPNTGASRQLQACRKVHCWRTVRLSEVRLAGRLIL